MRTQRPDMGPVKPRPERAVICTVEGCDRKHYGLGFCANHHARFKANGVPEIVRTTRVPCTCTVDGCIKQDSGLHGLCAMHYQRRRNTGETTHWCRMRPCINCGEYFSHNMPQAVYCSDKCLRRTRRAKYEKRHFRNGRGEIFTRAHLFARGEDRCHLCYEWVFPWETGPLEPTIDHLRPIVLPGDLEERGYVGGLHTLDNVKLAHRSCNTLRRNTLLDGPEITYAYMAP